MTFQRLAISTAAAEAASGPRETSFGHEGFAGPVRVFSAAQCRLIAAKLHGELPAPADWKKGQAVSDRLFYELATRPLLLSLLRPLIGDDIILWGAGLIERKPGQVHAWHTDIESSAPEGGFATVWIGIENTSRESGLQLITHSHGFGKSIQQVYQEKGLSRGEATANNVLAWAKEIDAEAQVVQPEVTVGEALIIDGRLWHGSHNSRRRGTRLALLLQYAAADKKVRIAERFEWPFQFLEEPRPPVIQVSGTSKQGINRIVPPPPPDPKQDALLTSGVYPLPLPLTEDKERRWRPYRILRGTTPAVEAMGCHMSILSAGHTPHPPHPHPEEEVLIAMEGEVELMISDSRYQGGSRRERIKPGAFVYYPPYLRHTIINPGTSPVTYLMLKWRGEARRAAEPLATSVIQYGDLNPPIEKPRWGQRLLRGETPYLGTFSSHVTVLEPGAGYEPHIDPYDVAIVLLSGTVETLGQAVAVPALIYCAAGEPHGMRNVGDVPARYLVFEFHPANVRASLWQTLARRLSVRAAVNSASAWLYHARHHQLSRVTRHATKRAARTGKLIRKNAKRGVRRVLGGRRLARATKRLVKGAKRGLRYFGTGNSAHRILKGSIASARNAIRRRGVAGAAKRLRRLALLTPEQRRCKRAERNEKRHLKRGRRRAKRAIKSAQKLRRSGDLSGALAAHEAIPAEFQKAKTLEDRGLTLQALGQLNAAYAVFKKALAMDPGRRRSWVSAGLLLSALGRRDEVPALIDEMLGALENNSRTLMAAASVARRGRHYNVADDLFAHALSPELKPSLDTILKAARFLITAGQQGRATALLDNTVAQTEGAPEARVLDLRGLALAQLRLAGGSVGLLPVDETARADVIAVNSIFEQSANTGGLNDGERRGIAIVLSTLGPAGIQRQTVRLVQQFYSLPKGQIGPIALLLVSRSQLEPEFHREALAGLDVTVERIADFASDVWKRVPAGVAGQLSVLPGQIGAQAAFLIDRLNVHRPEVVLAMSENTGLAAVLAGAIAGVPRVVVSGRGEPPPYRGLRDDFLKPAYQAALSHNRVSLVAISAATARQYEEWLEQPSGRVGVIYNGIDVEALATERDPSATAAHRCALGIADGARVVGSIFNERTEKRRELWIEAAAVIAKRAPDVVFVLVGGGHMRNDTCATIRQHGLEGRFHRPGVRKDVVSWLELMDVVLLTSESDATPNTLMEAQALGRPVVATDVGGVMEVFLPERTGVLLPADPTAEEIADAVMRILDNPAFADQARQQAPHFIRQRFGLSRMASEYFAVCFGSPGALGASRDARMET